MMSAVASILTNLYGPPVGDPRVDSDGLTWVTWSSGELRSESRLYRRRAFPPRPAADREVLEPYYGEYGGGFLVGGSLKMASIEPGDVYGLYGLEELAVQPELQSLSRARPSLTFFMDASNIWFYGIEYDRLIEVDSESGEVSDLGDPYRALSELVRVWERAGY